MSFAQRRIAGDAAGAQAWRSGRCAGTSRTRAEAGTGLCLAIVKHLMAAHGGLVLAESALGRGPTIHCWFLQPRQAGPCYTTVPTPQRQCDPGHFLLGLELPQPGA